jgi:hypothetical protein
MIRRFLSLTICLLLLSLNVGTLQASDCTVTGKMVYMQLVSSDRNISPFIMGGLKEETTSVALAINENTWASLSYRDRDDLFCYMPELVKMAKADPAKYLDMSQDAPVYKRFFNNVQSIPLTAWEIITGRPGPNGAYLDQVVEDGRTLRPK